MSKCKEKGCEIKNACYNFPSEKNDCNNENCSVKYLNFERKTKAKYCNINK
jgi:hypothetical protein